MTLRVFEHARIVDPSRNLDKIGTLIVRDGRIEAAGPGELNQGIPEGAERLDCRGLALLPGLVDAQVHIGEPGSEHRETIASASRAAAAGGVTSLIMMPDTHPPIDDVALVEFVKRAARETATVRIYPAAAVTRGLAGREMAEFGLLTEAGAVMLTDGRYPIRNPLVMRRALTYARDFEIVLSHIPLDLDLAGNGVMNEGYLASRLGLPGIPAEAELIPLQRDLALTRLTNGRYHAACLSAAMSAQAIREAKSERLDVTSSVSINHLSLNENDIGEYRTFFRLSPPLRAEDDRQKLIEALRDGTIDMIVSAHDPQGADTKRLPFSDAATGAVGLETLLGAALRLHHNGEVPLLRLVEALCLAPARRFGLNAGTLQPGAEADFILVDLDRPWVVREEALRSRSKNTPFEGGLLQGQVLQTVIAGCTVFAA